MEGKKGAAFLPSKDRKKKPTEVGGVVVALVLLVYSNYRTLVIIVDMGIGVPFLQVSKLFGCVYELFASTILFELNKITSYVSRYVIWPTKSVDKLKLSLLLAWSVKNTSLW